MHERPITLLIHLPAYAALLLSLACTTAPGLRPGESDAIQPVVDAIDADMQNTGGFSEEALYELLAAEMAGTRGQLQESVRRYLAIAEATRDPGVIERAARIALYAKDHDAARRAALLWLEADAQSPAAHQILGSLALEQGDEPAVLRHFRAIIAAPGPLPPRLWLIVGALSRSGDGDTVVRLMDEVLSAFRTDPEIMLAYADVLMRLNALDRAAEIYTELVTDDPTNEEALLARLEIFRIAGLKDDAEHWLELLLERTEGHPRNVLRMQLARLLAQEDKLLQAIGQLEQVLDEEPESNEAMLSASMLYLELGRNAEARNLLQRLVEREPFAHEAGYFLGWLSEQQDDGDTARQWYSSIAFGPRYPLAQIRMAVLQAGRGEVEPARLRLAQISNAHPEHRNLVIQAEVELLVARDRQEEALEVYDRAIGNEYNSELLYARALLAEKIDRLELMERDLRQIVEREPGNPQALNALGYALADHTDRYDEAYGLIKRALLLRPHSFYILDSMGWVLYRIGRLVESERYLRRSIDVKFDPVVAAHLAEVLWEQGKRREALRILDRAKRLHPQDETVRAAHAKLR